MTVRPAAVARVALLILFAAGCGGEDASTRVVVGLTTDMAVGFAIHRVERTVKVDGAVRSAESLSYSQGKLLLPAELVIEPADDGASIEVSVAAFGADDTAPIVTRAAATRAAGGRSLLLPVPLQEACSAVSCASGSTCVEGACGDLFVPPASLDDYDPAWIKSAPDACKTPLSGDPAIDLGQGESSFAPLADSEVVPIEPGPQGGHHVWLALRVTGLRQMGSRLTVNGHFPDLAFDLLPFVLFTTLQKTPDPHCEIYGIRFQVDRGIPVAAVRGQPLDIDIALEDPNGDVGTAMKRVVIAP